MLNSIQSDLYQRLQAFELDDPSHEFGFTRHLMKSQGWTLNYAHRAIAEYKKFAFLTGVVEHQVVPSDQVDQVWHAHVLCTQSYWEEFCPNILGKKLHHQPARGGRAERTEFHDLYAQTIASYRHFFGAPPPDIWSPPDRRFGAELKMQRVSVSEHWMIPKRLPQWQSPQTFIIATTLALVTVGCREIEPRSPLGSVINALINDQRAILLIAFILGLIVRYCIRIPHQRPQKPELDIYQIAYLAGGSSRVAGLVMMQLVHQGYLRPNVRNRTLAIAKILPEEAPPLQKLVMRQVQKTPEFKSLLQSSQRQTQFLQEQLALSTQLQQKKLLMNRWNTLLSMSFILFMIITFLGALIFGLLSSLNLKITMEPLLITLWSAVGLTTFCCLAPGARTRWGSFILAEIRQKHDVYDPTQRFALYGDRVLSGGALDDLKQMFKAEKEDAKGGCGCGC
jgi:uncharacterized protein (TIGR04222 family)